MKIPHWPIPPASKTIDLGLERMHALLKALGNPHRKIPPVVHVAGTNGKGSFIAFLRAMLEAAGLKVHVYTSPHLVEFNERIVLAGQKITDHFLHEVLEKCRVTAEKNNIPVTFFEGTTVAAFEAFAEVQADIVLLEVGLGGRLDSTNVVEKPVLTVITPISMDHMEFLGNSIAEIAGEKAAIIKQNVTCVIGPQVAEALAVIERYAKNQRAPLLRCGKEWQIEVQGKTFSYVAASKNLSLPPPHLVGQHQYNNAGTAVAAALELSKTFKITDKAIGSGISLAQWPARMHRLTSGQFQHFLNKGTELWLDGGHNEAAGQILATHAAQYWNNAPLYLVCGMLKTKATENFLKPFKGKIETVYAVPMPGEPAAKSPAEVKKAAETVGLKAEIAANVEEAVRRICLTRTTPCRILICGSLYLAGSVLATNA